MYSLPPDSDVKIDKGKTINYWNAISSFVTYFCRGNIDPEPATKADIFERDDGKLAFVHHKHEVIISNFTTEVSSHFQASSVTGYIFDVTSNERTW